MGTMRDDFNAAIDSIDADLEPTEQEVITPDVPEEIQEEMEFEGSESMDNMDEPEEEKAEAAPTQKEQIESGLDGKAKQAKESKDSIKAPVDWGPKEREQWSKIPRPLQEKIVSREKEMAETMANTAQARQVNDYINQLGQSYAPVLAAEGAESPLHAIKSLFDTVASLRMGTPTDKARTMGQLIQHYGIDIQALDSVLAGQAPQENPQNALEQMIDQKMQPVNQMMQQLGNIHQQQQQVSQQKVNGEVAEFGKTHEFFQDVRMQMADFVDMAAAQGRNISMEEAYNMAIAANPEIQQVIAERQKQQSIMGNQQSMAMKHNAASSIRGTQSGTPGKEAMNLRESIADAWNQSMGQ